MMFALLTVLVTLVQASASADSAQAAPSGQAAGDVNAGKRLFMKNTCYFCHGTAAQGGVAGARIAAVARNAQGFIRYVRRPAGQMPAYTDKILSDAELTDIFAYVRSLPPARSPGDIPLLLLLK